MAIAAFLFSFSLPTAYSQAGGGSRGAFAISKDSVLSTGLQKEVIDFFTSHPKMAKEIFPFEQDCIAGDEREVKACEEAVR